jgi:hypothetical protein
MMNNKQLSYHYFISSPPLPFPPVLSAFRTCYILVCVRGYHAQCGVRHYHRRYVLYVLYV